MEALEASQMGPTSNTRSLAKDSLSPSQYYHYCHEEHYHSRYIKLFNIVYTFSTAPATVRTSRSLYFNERRHFTSAVGRKEEEEEEERRRRRRREKERRAREEKERGGGCENAGEERMRRGRSMEREDRLELRGDVTYDRKRERAREEEREGMYNSGQNFHKTSYSQDFEGNLPKNDDNPYTLPHEFQQQESLQSDNYGEKFLMD